METTTTAANEMDIEVFVEAIDQMTLNGVLGAALMLLVGLVIIRIVMMLIGRLIRKLPPENKALMNFLRQGLRIVLYFILATTICDKLGLPVTSLVAVISLFGLAVSLSVQNVLANVVNGILILTARPFEVGDYIETASAAGTVDAIHLMYTHLLTPDNKRILVPNSELATQRITNYSANTQRRIDIPVRVGYEHSNQVVFAALLRAAEKTPGVLYGDNAPMAVVTSYEETGVLFSLRVWTSAEDYWPVNWALTDAVRTELAQDGILLTYGARRVIAGETVNTGR